MIADRTDPRYLAVRRGLEQLTSEDIRRVLEWPPEKLLLDGGNYSDGKFCPLCVALEIPKMMTAMGQRWSDYGAKASLAIFGYHRYGDGFVFNQLRGTPGSFYRDPHRMEDLVAVANEILEERGDR